MDDETVVPVCQTNRRGFTHFVAKKPGKYRLVNEEAPLDDISSLAAKTRLAIRFVIARQLLDGVENNKFLPSAPLSDRDWNDALKSLGEYAIDLTNEAKPATRAEAAVVLKTVIQTALGTVIESPYTNEYLTRDRIRIGAWVSARQEAIGKEFIKTYSSGGFNWIIAHGALVASEQRDMLPRDCDRYGVELVPGDGAYRDPAVATAEYFDHPCFAGTYVTDEPGTD